MYVPCSQSDHGPLELQLTPLIDCVFLLLVYFLWSSSFRTPELVLPGQLAAPSPPAAGSAPSPPSQADFPELVVRVLSVQGQIAWTVNETPVPSRTALRQILTELAQIQRQVPVILDPQPEVPLGEVIDALDAIRLAGFVEVQVAATLPP